MRYWVYKNSEISGPVAHDDISYWSGVDPHTLVCSEEVEGGVPGDWVDAAVVPELSNFVRSPSRESGGCSSVAVLPEVSTLLAEFDELEEEDPCGQHVPVELIPWPVVEPRPGRKEVLDGERRHSNAMESKLADLTRRLSQYETEQRQVLERLGRKEQILEDKDLLIQTLRRQIQALAEPPHVVEETPVVSMPEPQLATSAPTIAELTRRLSQYEVQQNHILEHLSRKEQVLEDKDLLIQTLRRQIQASTESLPAVEEKPAVSKTEPPPTPALQAPKAEPATPDLQVSKTEPPPPPALQAPKAELPTPDLQASRPEPPPPPALQAPKAELPTPDLQASRPEPPLSMGSQVPQPELPTRGLQVQIPELPVFEPRASRHELPIQDFQSPEPATSPSRHEFDKSLVFPVAGMPSVFQIPREKTFNPPPPEASVPATASLSVEETSSSINALAAIPALEEKQEPEPESSSGAAAFPAPPASSPVVAQVPIPEVEEKQEPPAAAPPAAFLDLALETPSSAAPSGGIGFSFVTPPPRSVEKPLQAPAAESSLESNFQEMEVDAKPNSLPEAAAKTGLIPRSALPAKTQEAPAKTSLKPAPKRRRSLVFPMFLFTSVLAIVILGLFLFKIGPMDLLQMFSMSPARPRVIEPERMLDQQAASAKPQESSQGNAPEPAAQQAAASEPPAAQPARDYVPNPGALAVEFVKNHPLGNGRSTIAQWLQYSFLNVPNSEEEWTAGAQNADIYIVQYRVYRGGRSVPQGDPIVYLFEADMQKKTVAGINPDAKALLVRSGPKQPAKMKARRKKPARRPGARKKPSGFVPQLPLPDEASLGFTPRPVRGDD